MAFLLVFLLALHAPTAGAGVFGDGDPENGTEDDRRGLSEGQGGAIGDDWYRSGGTVFCDGAMRGSATLVRTDRPGGQGVAIATAAHVFYDLERLEPWTHCEFHYLGLGALPGYQAAIAPQFRLMGDFDPAADPSRPERGAGDWAFAWLGAGWTLPSGARAIALSEYDGEAEETSTVGLLAWNRTSEELSVASGCRLVPSGEGDLGGGAWDGQLLDDCDSTLGASGGGLIRRTDGVDQLIGIRSGHHWDGERWPRSAYPDGPPDGMPWDPTGHTNYARAIDENLMTAFQRWWDDLPREAPKRHGEASTMTSP